MTVKSDFEVDASFAEEIQGLVTERTHGAIRQLRVDLAEDVIRVSGSCRSYYAKQLATQAVQDYCDRHIFERGLQNEIRVNPRS